MKTKKLLGMLLALTMVFSMAIIPQAVVQADYSDNVLFEHDFENYTGGAPAKDDGKGVTLVSLPNQNQSKKLFSKTENGNTYLYNDYNKMKDLYDNDGDESTKFSWGNVGFQMKFDETFTTGKYAVSFDFAMKEGALPEGDLKSFMMRTAVKRVDDKYAYLFAANADNAKVYGYKSNANEMFDTAGTYGGPVSITPGQVSRVDLVFDLDSKYSEKSTANGVVSGYVDGQLFTRKEFTDGLYSNNLNFYLLQEVEYFDNLKVAEITSTSFEAAAKYANNTATISFTESLLTEEAALDANDFTVTNAATGEAVAVATAAKTAYNEVTLTFADGAIKKGFKYIVTFGTDVKNIAGNAVAGTASFTLPAEEKQVYFEDFTGFETGDIVIPTPEVGGNMVYNGFKLLYSGGQQDANTIRFKAPTATADETGEEAIRVIRSASGTDGGDMAVEFPHKVYFEGEVSVEYRIRAGETLTTFNPYLIAKKNAGYQIQGSLSIPAIRFNSNKAQYSETTYKHNGTFVTHVATVDADRANAAYHTYKTVYNFDTETADIYFDGTKLNEEGLAITNYYHTSGGTVDGAPAYVKDYGYFDRIDFRMNTAEDAYVDIDYIKVTQAAPAPYVKGITYKDYQGNAADTTTAGIKEIAVSFGGNVSEASLENIKILEGAKEVTYEGAFDGTTRTYTMTIPGLLAGGKAYTLDLAAVADPYGAVLVGENEYALNTGAGTKGDLAVTFSKAKAEIAAGDKVAITATLIDTTGAAAENYALIGACYNGGTLSDVDLVTLTWNGCVGTAKANITVESLTDVAVKAFVLESLSTLAPVAGSPFVLD